MANPDKIGALKDIIRDLHRGVDPGLLKKRFAGLVSEVSAAEIGEMEQQLIDEGLPPEEIRKLCDLHAKIFEEALEAPSAPSSAVPGHPLHTLAEENKALSALVAEARQALDRLRAATGPEALAAGKARLCELIEALSQIERHYLKKENQLFPRLEAKGIGGPSKVMWAIHDDIRAHLKDLRRALDLGDAELIGRAGGWVLQEIGDMVAKEEKVLFPMALETFDESDWAEVKKGEEEIGYAWVPPAPPWAPSAGGPAPGAAGREGAAIGLDRGVLGPEQIDLILKRLPVDITLVDENDTVVYYSASPNRIFPRTPGIIGRKVQNCHPPKSLDVVNRIVRSFRAGERDEAQFWLEMHGRFIHIRYLALRDGQGTYRGVLEVTQDATAVRALRGERRLLDWARPKPDGEI